MAQGRCVAAKVEDPDIECVNVIFMTTSVLNQIEFEFTKLLDNLYFLTVYSNKKKLRKEII